MGNWAGSDLAPTLPADGTYTLILAGYTGNSKGSTYSFEAFQGTTSTESLTTGSEFSGSLVTPGDQFVFTFTGSIGQKIAYDGISANSNLYAQLLDPEGATIFSGLNPGNNIGPFSLATPGTYRLIIGGTGRATGKFDFRLLDEASQPKVQVNTTEAELTASLSAPATRQVLVAYGTADDTATAAGGDYRPASGVLRFEPGQTTASVAVQALNKIITKSSDFFVNLSNPVGATIAAGQGTGTVTIRPSGSANVGGEVFNDVNGNGAIDSGDLGIGGVTVELLGASSIVLASATTDASGNFTISGINPGSYTLAELVPSGYVQTAPPSGGTLAVTLGDGQALSGLNFGFFQPAAVSGQLFEDDNQNGQVDGQEAGLMGWTIRLLNSKGQVVSSATTDSGGNYAITALGPGAYTLTALLQAGYIDTVPSSGSYAFTATSGAQLSGTNFGVFKTVSLAVTGLSTLPGSGLQSSMSLVVQWSDANNGTAAAAGSYYDLVTIKNTSTNQVLASAPVLYDASARGKLGAGASAAQKYNFRLPDGPAGVGQIQFSVTADYTSLVSTAQGNPGQSATLTTTSILALYPDLQVTNFSATPGSGLQSGSHVVLAWDDANTGNGPTKGSWYDSVTLTNITTGEVLDSAVLYYDESAGGNGPIASGDFRAHQFALVLPDGSRGVGQLQFAVTTNVYKQFFEFNTSGPGGTSTAFSNNSASLKLASVLAIYPDLSVSGLSLAPASGLESGDPLTVSWSDANTGTGPVNAAFSDRVVIQNVTTGVTLATQDIAYDPVPRPSDPCRPVPFSTVSVHVAPRHGGRRADSDLGHDRLLQANLRVEPGGLGRREHRRGKQFGGRECDRDARALRRPCDLRRLGAEPDDRRSRPADGELVGDQPGDRRHDNRGLDRLGDRLAG